MLQAVRRAHRSALPRHASGAVLAAIAGRQRSFTRPASTLVASEDAQDAKAARNIPPEAAFVNPVTLLYEHPRMLLDAVKVIVESDGSRMTGEVLTQLVANPVVENRWDAIRALHALPSVADNLVDRPLLEPSHADAIAQLSKLPADTSIRSRSFGLIVKARYEDAPFLNAADLISALPLGDPDRFVLSYLEGLPLNLYRLQLHWERDALAGRNTTADTARAAAAEQLLLVEDHLREQHPTMLKRPPFRGALVRAFAAARAPEHAHRHRLELLKRPVLFGQNLDNSLAAARDLTELAAVWAETRSRLGTDAIPRLGSILALHYARVGGTGTPHEFLGLEPSAVGEGPQWAALAREAESQGAQLPADFAVPEPFKVLRANGLDWDGVAFMLGPFSPHRSRLARDRMLR